MSTAHAPSPEHILQLGLGFWGSKTLLTAIELGVFTELARHPSSAADLTRKLGLNGRGALDFFDALVAMHMLERKDGVYSNTTNSDLFLDRAKPTYVGGILEMANARLYPFWGHLTEALKTGDPQNEAKRGENFFARIYEDPARLRGFLQAMSGISAGAAHAIAAKFPWRDFKSVADAGAAQGMVPVTLARAHPHLQVVGYDLPPVGPVFEDFVKANGLSDRVRFQPGNFFTDPLPQTDVIVMGHILHDWDLAEKRQLVAKTYAALPKGGAYVVYDAMIDDDRRENVFGLLMSLNMLIETPGGFDYTTADCVGWLKEAGFTNIRVEHLLGPDSMVIGFK